MTDQSEKVALIEVVARTIWIAGAGSHERTEDRWADYHGADSYRAIARAVLDALGLQQVGWTCHGGFTDAADEPCQGWLDGSEHNPRPIYVAVGTVPMRKDGARDGTVPSVVEGPRLVPLLPIPPSDGGRPRGEAREPVHVSVVSDGPQLPSLAVATPRVKCPLCGYVEGSKACDKVHIAEHLAKQTQQPPTDSRPVSSQGVSDTASDTPRDDRGTE